MMPGHVGAWGVAQWPYVLPTSLTFSSAAAPTGTEQALLVVVVLVALLVLPSLLLLYRLDQKGLLPAEGITDHQEQSMTEQQPHRHAKRLRARC